MVTAQWPVFPWALTQQSWDLCFPSAQSLAGSQAAAVGDRWSARERESVPHRPLTAVAGELRAHQVPHPDRPGLPALSGSLGWGGVGSRVRRADQEHFKDFQRTLAEQKARFLLFFMSA